MDCMTADCAFCKRSTRGSACITCSRCSSHFHLECLNSETLLPSTNTWMCCKCGASPIVEPVAQ